ncbi:MAG TPA: hypothetical protein VNX68_19625 [Nitrosopumilaceae archaeon]|nr:hypothetical protein [Nitrosopumilaceae archaeon]
MKVIFSTLLLFVAVNVNSQPTLKVDGQSVGFIVMDSSIFVANAFVIDTKRQVIACAHDIGSNNGIYYAYSDSITHQISLRKLRIVSVLPDYDLEVLASDSDLCTTPLNSATKFPDFSDRYADRHIFYLGCDVVKGLPNLAAMQVNESHIKSIYGIHKNNGISIEMIDFVVAEKPVYTGGPVIDDNNKVVAIICNYAPFKLPNSGESSKWINTAYSLQPILKK